MKQAAGGRWQLRAVLSVPVPGHSSPLLASVAERSNLALAASAAISPDALSGQGTDATDTPSEALPEQRLSAITDLPGHQPDAPSGHTPDTSGDVVEAVAALLTSPTFLDRFAGALETREAERTAAREEVERLTAALAPARQEIAASMAGTVMRGEA